jgi:hypothetical protein
LADLALKQLQVFRVERELHAGARNVGSGINRAARVEGTFVNEEGALELNLAAKAAAITLAALVRLIAISQVIRQHTAKNSAAKRGPGVNRKRGANDFLDNGPGHLRVEPAARGDFWRKLWRFLRVKDVIENVKNSTTVLFFLHRY